MENQIQNQKPSDEIDLLELFNRMGNAIKSLFNWIIMLIKSFFFLLIKKSIWILSFSTLGAFIGYYLFINTPRFYSSEMIARSNSMNNSVIIGSINLLNDLFESRDYQALGGYLQIDPNQAKNIKSINALYAIDLNRDKVADIIEEVYNPRDTSLKRVPDVFYIRISVFDESVFPFVRNGVVKYIASNKYIQENNEIRKSQNTAKIETLQKEIKKLDSLQNVQYFQIPKMQKSSNSSMIVLNEKESKLYHTDIISLSNQKLVLEKDLALNPDPITVIQDFTPLSKAENPLIKFVKIWVILFAIIGFIVAIIWQNRRLVWSLIKSK